ncbi:Esterase/lipase superfamily enzyme [Tindallia magadiensis]|uniref:Esterase/lipase superfamily enzyme n=1 Tax=Tindallia magadiensis TaxID=69895 RepID=A0A1I3FDL7_9FIRM|nr:alpha/beta hydrolase-fold protein [Tindallia magadiensis]SFI09270.1 Esterase/lipase superfamily enzyme [Tindallia magadiensis]
MDVCYQHFHSKYLNRVMEFKRYGSSGKPMMAFPSSGGRFFEYEDFKMIEACQPFIEQGLIQVFTPDSIDHESWLDDDVWPGDRAHKHNLYDQYIIQELVPFILSKTDYQGKLITTGYSMGGYHAANFFFRHPYVFDTLIALSGIYDLRYFVGHHLDIHNVYINSPVDYLANLSDSNFLEQYKQSTIIICTGTGDWEENSIQHTNQIKRVLEEREIPAWIDYWGSDVNHDWPWWRKQTSYFLGELHRRGKLE